MPTDTQKLEQETLEQMSREVVRLRAKLQVVRELFDAMAAQPSRLAGAVPITLSHLAEGMRNDLDRFLLQPEEMRCP